MALNGSTNIFENTDALYVALESYWLSVAQAAIADHGAFHVALAMLFWHSLCFSLPKMVRLRVALCVSCLSRVSGMTSSEKFFSLVANVSCGCSFVKYFSK